MIKILVNLLSHSEEESAMEESRKLHTLSESNKSNTIAVSSLNNSSEILIYVNIDLFSTS